MKPTTLFILLTFVLIQACQQAPPSFNETAARKAIIDYLQEERTYHFEKMATEIAQSLSDSFLSVNRGVVSQPDFETSQKRFQNYFEAVEFEKWDDLHPPKIRFSDDGSLAYAILQKEVQLTYPITDDSLHRERTEYAWVSILRKTTEGWTTECISSTNKPTEPLQGHEN